MRLVLRITISVIFLISFNLFGYKIQGKLSITGQKEINPLFVDIPLQTVPFVNIHKGLPDDFSMVIAPLLERMETKNFGPDIEKNSNFISHYPVGENITRAEMAIIITRILGREHDVLTQYQIGGPQAEFSGGPSFEDINPKNKFFSPSDVKRTNTAFGYIEEVIGKKIMEYKKVIDTNDDGIPDKFYFKPNDSISRGEFIKILLKLLDYKGVFSGLFNIAEARNKKLTQIDDVSYSKGDYPGFISVAMEYLLERDPLDKNRALPILRPPYVTKDNRFLPHQPCQRWWALALLAKTMVGKLVITEVNYPYRVVNSYIRPLNKVLGLKQREGLTEEFNYDKINNVLYKFPLKPERREIFTDKWDITGIIDDVDIKNKTITVTAQISGKTKNITLPILPNSYIYLNKIINTVRKPVIGRVYSVPKLEYDTSIFSGMLKVKLEKKYVEKYGHELVNIPIRRDVKIFRMPSQTYTLENRLLEKADKTVTELVNKEHLVRVPIYGLRIGERIKIYLYGTTRNINTKYYSGDELIDKMSGNALFLKGEKIRLYYVYDRIFKNNKAMSAKDYLRVSDEHETKRIFNLIEKDKIEPYTNFIGFAEIGEDNDRGSVTFALNDKNGDYKVKESKEISIVPEYIVSTFDYQGKLLKVSTGKESIEIDQEVGAMKLAEPIMPAWVAGVDGILTRENDEVAEGACSINMVDITEVSKKKITLISSDLYQEYDIPLNDLPIEGLLTYDSRIGGHSKVKNLYVNIQVNDDKQIIFLEGELIEDLPTLTKGTEDK